MMRGGREWLQGGQSDMIVPKKRSIQRGHNFQQEKYPGAVTRRGREMVTGQEPQGRRKEGGARERRLKCLS